jgi:hypothetical protein
MMRVYAPVAQLNGDKKLPEMMERTAAVKKLYPSK